MKLPVFSVLAPVVFFAALAASAGQPGNLYPNQLEQKRIAVEDLAAEFHRSSGMIIVKAKIRNVSQATIRGYATIYLLSAEGRKIHAFQEEVNDGEGFARGATVDFRAESRVGTLDRVASISVDFTEE